MGQTIRENHHIIDKIKKKYQPKRLILQMAGCKFGKTMPVNRYTAAVSLCHFFKMTCMLPDWIVKIKTD